MRQWHITLLLLVLLLLAAFWWVPNTRMAIEAGLYDFLEHNPYVETAAEAEAIFAAFPSISVGELPETYLRSNKMLEAPFEEMCRGMRFRVLSKKDTYRKIAGNVRLIDVLSRDDAFHRLHYFSQDKVYLGIDERIIYQFIALQDALARSGYDPDALEVRFGHRHPVLNQEVGGASKSRHILGEALDINIDDIDGDGRYSETDKEIVLQLCDKQIIADQGGIGRYPGTRSIHIDVRGYRARWDQQ